LDERQNKDLLGLDASHPIKWVNARRKTSLAQHRID